MVLKPDGAKAKELSRSRVAIDGGERDSQVMELKLLAMVMGEVVRLGFAGANPLVSLKLKRDKPKKKPELEQQLNCTAQQMLGRRAWVVRRYHTPRKNEYTRIGYCGVYVLK